MNTKHQLIDRHGSRANNPNDGAAAFDAAVSKNISDKGYAYTLGRLSSCVVLTLLSSLPDKEVNRLLNEMAASLTKEIQ